MPVQKIVSTIKLISVPALEPFRQNPKLHPSEQIEKIKKSILEFGFNVPVLIDKKKNIIAGHGRVLAAIELKMKEVPCIEAAHLSPAQVKAFCIADNKTTESGWDYKLLAEVMKELQEAEYDLKQTAFDDDEISNLLEGMAIDYNEDAGPSNSGTLRNPSKNFIIGINNYLVIVTDEGENNRIKEFCDFMQDNPTMRADVDKIVKDKILGLVNEILPS